MKKIYFFILFFSSITTIPMAQTIDIPEIPATKKMVQQDNYHGTLIGDPYRWLEDDLSEETAQWVQTQNKITEGFIGQIPFRNEIEKELTRMWNYEKYSAPFKKGDYYFYFKNNGLQNQSVLYKQQGLNASPEIFLDPNTMNKNGTSSINSMGFSKSNRYMGYAVSQAGSDWSTIYIKEIKSGLQLKDSIEYTKFTGIQWYGDDGFFYSGYDVPKNVDEKFSAKTEYSKIFYHQLGTPQSQDILVFEDKEHPLRYKGVSLSDDQMYLILSQSEGTDGASIHYCELWRQGFIPRGEKYYRIKKDATFEFKELLPGFTHNYDVLDVLDGRFIVLTNNNAPNYRVVRFRANESDPTQWTDLIPEADEKLDNIHLTGGQMIAEYLVNASSKIQCFDLDGRFIRSVELPGIGSVGGFGGELSDMQTFYTFSSFNSPPVIYAYDIPSGKSHIYKKPKVNFEYENMVVEQRWFTSKDGTRVPMFLVRRNDLDIAKGPHPVLMYGYGGFNIPLTPSFSLTNLYFVQQGGIYVMVNLRGGSEFGEKWHRAGMLENKQNVFDDFISAGEYLIRENITSREKLAISGRSNGGLLVGACMTQRPDLFKVALPGVGVLDMLRYHKFTVGWGWVVEYGSSDHKKDFDYLIKYSPLHNLKKGTNYPCTLITTADHDDRVVPAHSFKFCATLQEMNTGKNPCLIRIDQQAGHGAGKPTSKVIEEYADVLAFTMYFLGMK